MVASFENKEERYDDVKPVIDLKQISRADGDEPKEKNMVSKKNSFDVILDILENLVVDVTKTINVVNTISFFTDKKKLEEAKQKLEETKQEKQKQQSIKKTNKAQIFEEINKGVEHVNASFVKKINDSKNRTSTQFFKSN